MHKAVIGAALVLALAGYSAGCSDNKRAADPVLRGQLADCAQAFDDAVQARGAGKLRAVIAGCSHACPGLADHGHDDIASHEDLTALFDRCKLFCTSEARDAWNRAAPAARFAALIEQCGPESYALTADSAPLLSADWAILLRVHEWLERHRDHAAADTRIALERAGMHAHFRLPLPARLPGAYELPESRAARPVDAVFYVIVDAGAEPPGLRAGAIPVARVRPGDLERRPVPGGEFPGQVLQSPAADYAGLVRLFEGMHPGRGGDNPHGHNPHGHNPHGGGDGERFVFRPLVLVDGGAPARAIVQATVALDMPRFVLGVSGHVAHAHPIELEHLTTTGSAAPVVKMSADGFTVLGGDKDVRVARDDSAAERLAAELHELSVQRAPQDKIEVDLPAGATVTELVQLLDIIARSNFRVALVRVAEATGPATR